jgi:hypothetical protein
VTTDAIATGPDAGVQDHRVPAPPTVFDPARQRPHLVDDQARDGEPRTADLAKPDAGDTTRPAAVKPKPAPRPGRKTSPVRQAVERALLVATLDAPTIELLSVALDLDRDATSGAGLAEVAVASIEAGDTARSTLACLDQILGADDMEAASIATGLAVERAPFKRLWTVLGVLDTALAPNPPARAAQAGLAAARSIRKLGAAQRKTLGAARRALA